MMKLTSPVDMSLHSRILGYRETQILAIVLSDLAENGRVRSYEAIGAALGIRHKSGVANVISRLERRGFLTRVGSPGRRFITASQMEGVSA